MLKTTYIDAVKKDPDLTIAGYVNEMVGARVNLDSISDDVFKELLTTAFKGSSADGYITRVLNTDGIRVLAGTPTTCSQTIKTNRTWKHTSMWRYYPPVPSLEQSRLALFCAVAGYPLEGYPSPGLAGHES